MASRGKKSFVLRIDLDLWAEVERLSAQELRSANAQAEYLLRDALERRGRLGAAARPPGRLNSKRQRAADRVQQGVRKTSLARLVRCAAHCKYAHGSTRKLPVVRGRNWPMPGSPADELIATLLTHKTTSWPVGFRFAVPRAGRRRSANSRRSTHRRIVQLGGCSTQTPVGPIWLRSPAPRLLSLFRCCGSGRFPTDLFLPNV